MNSLLKDISLLWNFILVFYRIDRVCHFYLDFPSLLCREFLPIFWNQSWEKDLYLLILVLGSSAGEVSE